LLAFVHRAHDVELRETAVRHFAPVEVLWDHPDDFAASS
jgi:hypothetical protein